MNGTVEQWECEAKSLVGNPLGDSVRRRTPVYLPPGYSSSSSRFPVLYFLHGIMGSGQQWLNVSSFTPTTPERLDVLVAAGKVPPFIGVFVEGGSTLGGSQWDNSEAIGNYRDYVVRDVVPQMDSQFRTLARRESRAVLGKSSGGYGSLVMAQHHSDVFGHIACHSGDAAFEYCYLPSFPKVAGVLGESGGVEGWWTAFRKRAAETKPKGSDFDVANIVAMSAAYSPRMGAPLNLELPFDLATAEVKESVWQRWLARILFGLFLSTFLRSGR